VREKVETLGPLEPVKNKRSDGPARVFRIRGAKGTIAFITPVSNPFCGRCNRLRLTSDGRLRACLIEEGGVDLREILRRGGTDDEIREAFKICVEMKPLVHGAIGPVKMHEIGG
jgi:cyclic pyranopterin phosphate synthase